MTMAIVVRFFAMQRQQVGARRCDLAVPDGATVADAWRSLVALYPVLEPGASSVRFARNGVYADADEGLAEGDELALIPPVAGGAGGAGDGAGGAGEGTGAAGDLVAGDGTSEVGRFRRIELHPTAFDDALLADLRRSVPGVSDGAVVLFLGQTRESPGTPAPGEEAAAARLSGQSVESLEYEAFESMALAVLETIAVEIEARFGVRRLAILHRTGEVPLGEASVVIAAAAAHRADAFEAARYAIEELKARAPIWKSERFADGSVWVGAPARGGPISWA